jgi:hypothetical protein
LRPADPVAADALAAMRAFVAAVMRGEPAWTGPAPPIELVKRGHLGPIAYRMGIAALRDEYAASTIVALRRAAVLREVIAALDACGVRTALLKGSAFVGTIYADPAERPMNDLDLLVPPRQLAEATRIMLARGFERVGMARKLSGYYHAIVFVRDGMMVELHRNIVQPYRTGVRMGELWRRARPDPLGSGAARLAPIDELLLCMLHVARHELAVPVLNYVDVARAAARLDADARAQLDERARGYRISRALAAVAAMTELLASGRTGRPALGPIGRVLPSSDDVLVGARPRRLRQIGQKLLLTEGPRELAGLGFVYVRTYLDGLRRIRS